MSKSNPDRMLYYGDNLDILRRYIDDESVDLVYADPPFNSNRAFNVFFGGDEQESAQAKAFDDTWRWDHAASAAYDEVLQHGGQIAELMRAFRLFLGETDMMAYLANMAPRLIELRRVLRETGSIYLHCDPTASHYLKLLMDGVFGPKRFRSEIIWKRSSAHSDTKQGLKKHGRIHDVILFYTKGDDWTWNPVYTPYDASYDEAEYRHVMPDGRRYKETDLTAAKPGGDTEYEWRVKRPRVPDADWEADLDDEYLEPKADWEYLAVPPYKGRFWAYSRDNLVEFARTGHLIHRSTGMPRLVQYADEMPGVALQDLWADIPPIGPKAAEKLGYPTQKPIALLERILEASSSPGDVVLDPFCGCGTTIAAAEALGRRWVGIDITHLAINLIRHRLVSTHGKELEVEVVGEPVSVDGAAELASQDPYQFQWWILGLVGARPVEQKKGADRGIDGRLYFHDTPGGKTRSIIISVKAGKTGSAHVRDLRGVLEREKAEIGVLLTMNPATTEMRREAAAAGIYHSPWGGSYPRIQILTVEDLLDGKGIDYPRTTGSNVTYKPAPKHRPKVAENLSLLEPPS